MNKQKIIEKIKSLPDDSSVFADDKFRVLLVAGNGMDLSKDVPEDNPQGCIVTISGDLVIEPLHLCDNGC